MKAITWIVRLVFLLVFIALAAQNMSVVSMQIIPGLVWNISLIVLLLIFFVIGAVLGIFSIYSLHFQSKQKYLKIRKQFEELEVKPQQ